MNKQIVSTFLLGGLLASAQAQTVAVDWLYTSPAGSWAERSERLDSETSALRFPIENINPSLFWWHAEDATAQVSWQSQVNNHWPKVGDVAIGDSLQGEWLVERVTASSLVLIQNETRRYWPTNQLHLLQWPVTTFDDDLELTIQRQTSQPSDFSYAWQDYNIRATVNYRISMTENPVLHQTLILTNDSTNDIEANGYSYSKAEQPIAVMHEMVSRIESDVAVPKASQSQGIATLVSNEPIKLQAQSSVWLPVKSIELQPLERRYTLNWDTRMQGLQQANSQLKLTAADTPLPTIAGPVTLGVFDKQLPVMNSQYQPSTKTEAELTLGQSSLVTLESKRVGENQWSLLVVNRTEEDATLELMITHWNGNRSDKIPMKISVKADDHKTVEVSLAAGGKIRIDKN